MDQTGGDVNSNINNMDIGVNKYLRSEDKTVMFKFEVEGNLKTTEQSKHYFASGSGTAVFKMGKTDPTDRTKYILRVIDSTQIYDINKFIDKYMADKINFGNNMIEIYYYGIIIKPGAIIAPYVITKEYGNDTSIIQLSLPLKISLVTQMLDFIILLGTKNYVYRDLKFPNIGYELLDSGDIKFIVLDYDMITLVPLDTFKMTGYGYPYWQNLSYQNNNVHLFSRLPYGTYPPVYLLNTVINQNLEDFKGSLEVFKVSLAKMASVGIANVLNNIFVDDAQIQHNYNQLFYTLAHVFDRTVEKTNFNYWYTQCYQNYSKEDLENKESGRTYMLKLILALCNHVDSTVPTTENIKQYFLLCFNESNQFKNKYLKQTENFKNKYLKYKQKYLALKYSK